MKLKDFINDYLLTQRIYIQTKENFCAKPRIYLDIPYNERKELDNRSIISVDAMADVSEPSPITGAIDVRPVICILLDRGEQND